MSDWRWWQYPIDHQYHQLYNSRPLTGRQNNCYPFQLAHFTATSIFIKANKFCQYLFNFSFSFFAVGCSCILLLISQEYHHVKFLLLMLLLLLLIDIVLRDTVVSHCKSKVGGDSCFYLSGLLWGWQRKGTDLSKCVRLWWCRPSTNALSRCLAAILWLFPKWCSDGRTSVFSCLPILAQHKHFLAISHWGISAS